MVTTTRTQNRYDHRLRELVRTTQDVSYAVQCGVPRSTACGWMSASTVEVVTLDSLNMDASELQREVLHLQTRIRKLIALLRVLLVVLKISRFSLNQTRFPDGKDKHSLLRVVDQSRSALPLRSVLRELSGCRRRATAEILLAAAKGIDHDVPTVLADGGTENFNGPVDELVTSGLLRRVLARTEIIYSNSMIESWWRVLKHQWLYLNSLDTVATVRKLVSFYVEQHNIQLPHSAFRGQTPDEMYFKTGDDIPAKLEAARLKARQARAEANRKQDCEACELLATSLS